MNKATASIRELRTDFRSVKQKVEQFGSVTITDHGVPSFELKAVAPVQPAGSGPMPDYYSRVQRRQPKVMSATEVKRFWEGERGER